MNREEIIKGLGKIGDFFRARADIAVGDGKMLLLNWMKCVEEAAEAMKAQEPRVLTWEEARASVNSGPFIIMEVRDSTGAEVDYGVLVEDSYEMSDGSLLTLCDFWMLEEEYGKRFRCWTSRPTDEQREATPWLNMS